MRARRSLRSQAGYHLNVYVDDELYVAEVTPEARAYADFQHLPIHPVGDLLAWLDEPPTKLVAVGEPKAMDALEVELKAPSTAGSTSRSRCRSSSSSRPRGHEGRRRSRSSRSSSASRSTATVAFGDGENDVELLEWAGYGVAVANAHERVLERRRPRLPAREDEGVAAGARGLPRLTRDDRRPRRTQRPRGFRAAVARKGAAEAFDELIAADARWRELETQVTSSARRRS